MENLRSFIKIYGRFIVSILGVMLVIVRMASHAQPEQQPTVIDIEEPIEEKETVPRNADQKTADTIGAALDKSFGENAHYSIDTSEENTITITITVDGMGASVEAAKTDDKAKGDWVDLVDAMKNMSAGFKKGAESYGSKKDISVILVNDEDSEQVLVGTMNDIVFLDILGEKAV